LGTPARITGRVVQGLKDELDELGRALMLSDLGYLNNLGVQSARPAYCPVIRECAGEVPGRRRAVRSDANSQPDLVWQFVRSAGRQWKPVHEKGNGTLPIINVSAV
jgi:hypothetical protein